MVDTKEIVHSEIKKWYSSLKKEMQDLELGIHLEGGYTFKIKEIRENRTVLTTSRLRIRMHYGVMSVQVRHGMSFLLDYQHFVMKLIQQIKPVVVFVELDERSKEVFQDPYVLMESMDEKKWSALYKKNVLYKFMRLHIVDEEAVRDLLHVSARLKQTFLKMKKEDELFKHRFQKYDYRLQQMSFYHQGKEDVLNLDSEQAIFSLADTSGWKKSWENVDDIGTILSEYFEKIYKGNRLQNVFSAPKHHFQTYMDKCVRYKNLHNAILQQLSKHYSMEEIEKKLARAKLTRITSTKSYPLYGIIEIMDFILVLDAYREKIYTYPIEKREEAGEKFKELNLHYVLTEVNTHLNRFKGVKK